MQAKFSAGLSLQKSIIRAACLQNETAPKSLNFKTKNGPKNDPKLPRKMLSLVLLCRISHRHYSKIFHREFPHKIKYFFTTRICRHGHANNNILLTRFCRCAATTYGSPKLPELLEFAIANHIVHRKVWVARLQNEVGTKDFFRGTTFSHEKCWSRHYAERIWGEFFILVRRSLGRLPANFSANFDSEFFGLVFPGFEPTQKNSRPKFTSRIVGIPLQFHFLEPKISLSAENSLINLVRRRLLN